MLQLHKSLAGAKTPTEKAALERQIAATDGQIDQLVYELYGLTDDEIKIVEEATQDLRRGVPCLLSDTPYIYSVPIATGSKGSMWI